ncbi:MAG: NAD(P)-dependent glycerol-3-phosphate dehydrogenase [Magnetococcales bacterium]|nr:NAD(P)-dependent glycerol-3-phosphate dehydrogenase [Magnetococcales bacterium]MBF0322923.1 NAD(P)-dependent glycerol-3-phosphate dehydrogenase [Magnetococcales bacterium]
MNADPSVAVVGAGSWGTALAALLAGKLPQVTLWCHEPEVAAGINQNRRNPLFLSDMPIPDPVRAVTDLGEVAARHSILVMVAPTQVTRQLLTLLQPHLHPEAVLVCASKGIEESHLLLTSELYAEILGEEVAQRACFLSGPSFAREVMLGHPAAVVVAGREASVVTAIQELFSTPRFRTYSSDDVVGVELGGALKNVVSLAAGISDGLGFGHSARAALITRGLAEIIRLGVRLGGRPETFSGLSGLGDLLLTATSTLSRNHAVGYRLGQGETLADIQAGMREVAEGVHTTRAARQLADRHQVEMPITHAVHAILYGQKSPRSVVEDLMGRQLKPEVTILHM